MGELVRVSEPGMLKPIEHSLIRGDIRRIYRSYLERPKKIVVPTKELLGSSRRLVLLDGHHSSCLADTLQESGYRGVELYAWVAESPGDEIPELPEGFDQRNREEQNYNIARHFRNVLFLRGYVRREFRLETVRDLRRRHPYLGSEKELLALLQDEQEED
ncbi:MAG: hypothetical protein NUV97_04225 [archaeon]|nr:hypothetical protein [archaeon]MCR4323543.1 hypothetical protein [Nanoarchaeota archaeon]